MPKTNSSVDSEQAKDERETRRQDDRLLGQLRVNALKLSIIKNNHKSVTELARNQPLIGRQLGGWF